MIRLRTTCSRITGDGRRAALDLRLVGQRPDLDTGKLDLADRVAIVDSQLALWRFFWGEGAQPGYLAGLSQPEQEAALELLDRHHAEAVLLASVFEAYDITWHEADDRLPELRDLWRAIVTHDLWQPTKEAVGDAAAVAGAGPGPMAAADLLDELEGLARYYTDNEPRGVIAMAVGASLGSVLETEGRVQRGHLGEQTVDLYVINDDGAQLTPASAAAALSALAGLRPDASYFRLTHPASKTVAFADFETDDFLWANQASGAIEDLELPHQEEARWERALEGLRSLAA